MSNFKDTLLISETVLKDNSILTDNIDFKNVRPSISYVQDTTLQQTMGTKLFREVQRQVYNAVNSGGSIESRISTLLDDYIEDILVNGVVAESVWDLVYKFGNLTVLKNHGDNEKSINEKEVNRLVQRYKNRMEWYVNRLDEYLCENQVLYPEFNQNVNEDVRPSRKPYRSAIFTGRSYEQYYLDKLPPWVRYKNERP